MKNFVFNRRAYGIFKYKTSEYSIHIMAEYDIFNSKYLHKIDNAKLMSNYNNFNYFDGKRHGKYILYFKNSNNSNSNNSNIYMKCNFKDNKIRDYIIYDKDGNMIKMVIF
jgi:hypothetical protein